MQILCKVKDFYDYACLYQQERDPFPTFDRKNYTLLNNDLLISWIVDLKRNPDIFNRGVIEDEYFYLEVGAAKYIFKAINIVRKNLTKHPEQYEFDCNISLIRTIEHSPNIFSTPLAIAHVDLNYEDIKSYHRTHKQELVLESCPIEIMDFKPRHNWLSYDKYYDVIETPILKNTYLAGLLDPHKIYINLDNYLRSLYNDVTQESKGLTDNDKAVNKGFDKKESFRNIYPRS